MQFETLLLRGLFLACLTISGLILGAMLTSHPQAMQVAANGQTQAIASAQTAQASTRGLPADGVICPRRMG